MAMKKTTEPATVLLTMDVLQQFRLIFGSMRQYFRLVEERCGLSGSQMWVLQEVARSPGLGVGDLARRMGIHQSTCSLLVDRLVAQGGVAKSRQSADQHRDVVLAASAIHHVLKQEGLALALGQAAELQANQRVELGVFIDRRRYALQLAGLVERLDIFSER